MISQAQQISRLFLLLPEDLSASNYQELLIIGKSSPSTFVQDRNSINRDRGSAEYGHLFHDEVVAAGARFQWACEFREKETGDEEKALIAAGRDPNREALRLLLESLEVLEHGYCTLGGKTGTGHGRFRLEQLHGFWMDHQEPDDVLTFALEGPEAFETRHPLTPQQRSATFAQSPIHVTTPASQKGPRPGPECIIFRGVLRPLDPLLVKTGYSMGKRAPYREPERTKRRGFLNLLLAATG